MERKKISVCVCVGGGGGGGGGLLPTFKIQQAETSIYWHLHWLKHTTRTHCLPCAASYEWSQQAFCEPFTLTPFFGSRHKARKVNAPLDLHFRHDKIFFFLKFKQLIVSLE